MSVGWRPELWLLVIAFGAYHGLNPGMGWPLAVANGMWAKRGRAVFATLLPLAGGPQMVEISRDGRRVYLTNGLYSTWDRQFYGQAIPGVEVMCNADPNGGIALDKDFFVEFGDGYGAHQVRLEGGDCSTDSFCYPSA